MPCNGGRSSSTAEPPPTASPLGHAAEVPGMVLAFINDGP